MTSAIHLPLLLAGAACAAGSALAAAPRVVADIAPVQSIAAAIMAGVGAPVLIVPPGVSEHNYTLRPSEAEALAAADLVVWIGPGLTPWLSGPLDALARDAARLTLQDAAGVSLLGVREGGPFEAHDHADEGAEADHGHSAEGEDHGDAGEHDAAAGDDHADAEDHADEHGAEQAGSDPHLWLDPRNGAAAGAAIAAALAKIDPANAGAYSANAAAFADRMEALEAEIDARLAPLRDRSYFVFHDAYRYFEERFALPAAGSIALSDAAPPRAARVAEIRDRLASEEIDCAFAEPQYDSKLLATVIEGTPTRTGALDPLGIGLEPGPDLYPALLRGLAENLAACLEGTS